jgi:hypothetical protein
MLGKPALAGISRNYLHKTLEACLSSRSLGTTVLNTAQIVQNGALF